MLWRSWFGVWQLLILCICFGFLFLNSEAVAFENAKVLPGGVSRLSVKWFGSEVTSQTDGSGRMESLGSPLETEIRFQDVLNFEPDPLLRELAAGFLLSNDGQMSESLGSFQANVTGRVQVWAPVFGFGLSEAITIAAVLPIYTASTNVSIGFVPSSFSNTFRDNLSNRSNNQLEGAREFVNALNNVNQALNQKLVESGYAPLGPWQDSGLGDARAILKALVLETPAIRAAVQGAVVMPTGREDNPDQLLDLGFGDGQWDLNLNVALDQAIGATPFTASYLAGYTLQLPGARDVRLKTQDEQIEVPRVQVQSKLGDIWALSGALVYEGQEGLVAGLGYGFEQKQKDQYFVPIDSKSVLEAGTFKRSHTAILEFGYSGVSAYRRGDLVMPFDLTIGYARQLASQNSLTAHRFQIESGVFF